MITYEISNAFPVNYIDGYTYVKAQAVLRCTDGDVPFCFIADIADYELHDVYGGNLQTAFHAWAEEFMAENSGGDTITENIEVLTSAVVTLNMYFITAR